MKCSQPVSLCNWQDGYVRLVHCIWRIWNFALLSCLGWEGNLMQILLGLQMSSSCHQFRWQFADQQGRSWCQLMWFEVSHKGSMTMAAWPCRSQTYAPSPAARESGVKMRWQRQKINETKYYWVLSTYSNNLTYVLYMHMCVCVSIWYLAAWVYIYICIWTCTK